MLPSLQRPSTAEVRSAIRVFRAIVEGAAPVDYAELTAAITNLMNIAARMKGEPAGDEEQTLQRRSSPADHVVVQERFTELRVLTADDDAASDLWTAMPLDDLGDLYHDIRVSEDMFECGDETGARWDFRFGFENHWGEHALSLVGYLLHSYRA